VAALANRGLRNAWKYLRIGQLGARIGACPACGPTLLIRLARDPVSVRCVRCRASGIHMSIVQVLRRLYPELASLSVYELSSRGPLFEYLKARAGNLECSEYFDDAPPGEYRNGVQCQDVARLTYVDASFDLCTATEVLEHVPDDEAGFREIRRVLRPGGRFVFTVPLSESAQTVTRAELANGEVRHLLAPEYHGDAIRGQGRVLVYRDYGRDIIARLQRCGFSRSEIVMPDAGSWWGLGRDVIVAVK
jgi:SAM-dependent methyltransferase